MIESRTAARLLLLEGAALERIVRRAPAEAFAGPTVCDGWSVRDVLAHCAAALTRVASGEPSAFTPPENQRDVDARRDWPLEKVLEELFTGCRAAAEAVSAAGGRLDGVALGMWVHGGDIRAALGEPDAYTSAGVDVALDLLVARSAKPHALPAVVADLPDRILHLGHVDPASDDPPARVVADVETIVRLLTGRHPDPARYHLENIDAPTLNLFTAVNAVDGPSHQ